MRRPSQLTCVSGAYWYGALNTGHERSHIHVLPSADSLKVASVHSCIHILVFCKLLVTHNHNEKPNSKNLPLECDFLNTSRNLTGFCIGNVHSQNTGETTTEFLNTDRFLTCFVFSRVNTSPKNKMVFQHGFSRLCKWTYRYC